MVLSQQPRVKAVKTRIWTLCACLSVTATQTLASVNLTQATPDLCVGAAQTAADRTGVPLSVLMAVTLTETGRRTDAGLAPWPWAINQAGKGYWFATQQEAVDFADSQLALGLQNFDVGCFQLNHRWHSKGFRSTADMFDPTSNALYAARFLAELYAEKGDWSLAAATYHSRTPEEADIYRAKFDAILAGLPVLPRPDYAIAVAAPRINNFPLLQGGRIGKSGSLVPLLSSSVRLIGQQP